MLYFLFVENLCLLSLYGNSKIVSKINGLFALPLENGEICVKKNSVFLQIEHFFQFFEVFLETLC